MINWISVKDELPKPDVYVLTYGKYGVIICRYIARYHQWYANPYNYFRNGSITHWAPLSEIQLPEDAE